MAVEQTMVRKTKIMREDNVTESTRVTKKRRRETTLADIPNELLIIIISSLSVADAARTSILAKRWQCLWRHTTHLDLEETSMIKSSTCSSYGAVIGMVLNSHIGDLTSVRFKHFPSGIPGELEFWVDFVLNKYKKITSLSFECERFDPISSDDRLSFRRSRLYKIIRPNFRPMLFSTLSSLELTNYPMWEKSTPEAFDGCGAKLKTLKIKNMRMSDDVINSVLSKCLCLESLSIVKSKEFISTLVINNPCLKFLELGCLDVDKVDVDVEGLEILVLDSLECPPTGFKIHALHLRILKVSCNSSSLTKRTSLLKTQDIFEQCGDLYLQGYSTLRLETLEITIPVEEDSVGADNSDNNYWERRDTDGCTNHKLRFVTIKGFRGKEQEVKFIEHLIRRAPLLKKITIICESTTIEKEARALLSLPRDSVYLSIILKCKNL